MAQNYNGSKRTLPNYGRSKSNKRGQNNQKMGLTLIIIAVIVILSACSIIGRSTDAEKEISKDVANTHQNSENGSDKQSQNATEPGSKPTGKGITFDTDAAYAENHKYCVGVNRQQNVITIYGQDADGKFTEPVKAMLCSCGKPGGDDTPDGTFKTTDKVRWLWLVNNTYGQYTIRINGHIWFHSVPYYSQDPSDLEYEEYNKLGTNASLGCVRVNVADAKWMYENLDYNTIVTIYDSEDPGPLGKLEGLKLDTKSPNRGWDPTDPDSNNPWNVQNS